MNPLKVNIFNPDTDYALASSAVVYTPPANVRALRQSLALLPAIYAGKGEKILILDPPGQSPLLSLLEKIAGIRDMEILHYSSLKSLCQRHNDLRFDFSTWGWNPSLLHSLNMVGAISGYDSLLERILKIRSLSHRRTSVAANQFLKDFLPETPLPKEFFSTEDALVYLKHHPSAFFKAPWSSSGRGIIRTSDLEMKHIHPWIAGIIKSQGSVVAEPEISKHIDFATEWKIENGKPSFIGFAMFEASTRGKFHFNYVMPQKELRSVIANNINIAPDYIVDIQHRMLESVVGENYSGYLGIDMMADNVKRVIPCVEINFRLTMGMVAIRLQQLIEQSPPELTSVLQHLVTDKKLSFK